MKTKRTLIKAYDEYVEELGQDITKAKSILNVLEDFSGGDDLCDTYLEAITKFKEFVSDMKYIGIHYNDLSSFYKMEQELSTMAVDAFETFLEDTLLDMGIEQDLEDLKKYFKVLEKKPLYY